MKTWPVTISIDMPMWKGTYYRVFSLNKNYSQEMTAESRNFVSLRDGTLK